MAPTALILGITGQDGSYLAELLLAKGYAVHGLVRRASMFNRGRIEHLRAQGARSGGGRLEAGGGIGEGAAEMAKQTGPSLGGPASLRAGWGESKMERGRPRPRDDRGEVAAAPANSGLLHPPPSGHPSLSASGHGAAMPSPPPGSVRSQVSDFSASPDPKSQTPDPKCNSSLELHYSDLTDATSLRRIIRKVRPAEVYHLAGQSHVGLSFEMPEVTCQENAAATLALLEILRDLDHPVRLYHAASSELFGAPARAPQNENTPFNPVNPYGCAKAFAAQMVRVYRQAYGLFAVNGIAYNHESPRRGENFVTRKITTGAARIRAGKQREIRLGNLDARRDWGWAPEYVEAMWRSLQAKEARDYILATGRACSVREFAQAAFGELGLKLKFEGEGKKEVARRTDTGAIVLRVDPKFYRPLDSVRLVGDARLARLKLKWKATVAGADVARRMAAADAEALAASAEGVRG